MLSKGKQPNKLKSDGMGGMYRPARFGYEHDRSRKMLKGRERKSLRFAFYMFN